MQSKISRRTALAYSFLSSCALALQKSNAFGATPRQGRKGPQKRVVVIGAGLSGLSVAYELIQAGHEVTVLEAQGHPGGRVLTLRNHFADGLYAELGATRIPSSHWLTLGYINEFELPLEIFPATGKEMFLIGGKRFLSERDAPGNTYPMLLTPEEKSLGFNGMMMKYFVNVTPPIGMRELPGWPGSDLYKAYSGQTCEGHMRKLGASNDAIQMFRAKFGGIFDEWPLLQLLSDVQIEGDWGAIYAIKGGNDQLPRAFAERISKNIKYCSPVSLVHQDKDGVEVHFGPGNSSNKIRADYAVCTVGLKVQNKITFTPQLSTSKQSTVSEIHYASITRGSFQCKQRFWKDEGLGGLQIGNTDTAAQRIWDLSAVQPGTRGILLSYIFGNDSKKITAMNATERGDFIKNQVASIFPVPAALGHIEATHHVKCWDEDEWIGGAAAVFSGKSIEKYIEPLAEPEGRIHFAGCHTSPWPAFMQGALFSGQRAANAINGIG